MNYSDPANLTPELQAMVDAELQPGERVGWMDQPLPGRLSRGAIPIVLFGIPWTAFAVFWICGAAAGTASSHEPGFFRLFPLFGLPFVAVGIGMLSSPYWIRRAARRTVYVLTDRRAIIFKGGWRGSVDIRSFEAERLTELSRKQYNDGSGNLVFTRDLRRNSDGDRSTTEVGFMAVPNVKSVEDMIRALMQARHAQDSPKE